MKTLEMIKKLIENPEKKYVSEKNRACEMIAHIRHRCLIIENTSNKKVTSIDLNREWEEAKEPVSFMEAFIEFRNNTKNIKVEAPGMPDKIYYGKSEVHYEFHEEYIHHGKWYIED